MQCFFSTKFSVVAFFGVFRLFHFSLSVYKSQSSELSLSNNTNNNRLYCDHWNYHSYFWTYDPWEKFMSSALNFQNLAGQKHQQWLIFTINIKIYLKINKKVLIPLSMKMNDVRLSSSYRNHIHLKCVFQKIWKHLPRHFSVSWQKKNSKLRNILLEEFPGFVLLESLS